MQVLLVTSGYTWFGSELLNGDWTSYRQVSSTELLLPSATSWRYSAALPSPRNMLRGATLDNKVLMTGTNSDTLMTAHDSWLPIQFV